MDIFSAAERLMAMDEGSWARHANPLSGWSRLFAGPLIFLALWSPFWIGLWGVLPILAAVAWSWLNPRLFPPPDNCDAWMTKGVLGERVFLNRKQVPVPDGFQQASFITTGFSLAFLALAIYGFVAGSFWLAFTAWHAAILSKVWFIDRCVWLWGLMADKDPQYAAWGRADWTIMTSPSPGVPAAGPATDTDPSQKDH